MAGSVSPSRISDPRPQVISASSTRIIEESGLRPLPRPIWKARNVSHRTLGAVAVLWLSSLTTALCMQTLALRHVGSDLADAPLWCHVAFHIPWMFSLLWSMYGGLGYGLIIQFTASLLLAGSASRPWFSGPLALIVFAGIQSAFSIDPRLRTMPSLGAFVFSSFCAAVTLSLAGLMFGSTIALTSWASLWFWHFILDLALTCPFAILFGGSIERMKRIGFGYLPELRVTVPQQFLALLLSLLILIAFCVTWTVAADASINLAIKDLPIGPHARRTLLEAQQSAAFRKAALVAGLLGAVSGGAALVILVLRKKREQLRDEVQRNTENLRRRHLQLATLQQVTESANRSSEGEAVYRELAQILARMTDAAQVAIYVPDSRDNTSLRLIEGSCIRPLYFVHREYLRVDSPPIGDCFRSGTVTTIPEALALYVDDEALRAQYLGSNLESLLAIPITGERAIVGVASVFFDRRYEPDEEERRLFNLIGRAVGAALERTEIHAKARRFAGDLGGLYRFSQQLASEGDERALLKVAAPAARRLLQARTSVIFLVNGEGDAATLDCATCDADPERTVALQSLRISTNDSGLIAEAVREIRTTGIGIRGMSSTQQVLTTGWNENAAMVVPLSAAPGESGSAGVFVWTFDARVVLGLEESGLAEEIARQTAAGLRRARLIEKTRRQATELKLLEQIGRTLSQRLTMSYTLEQSVENVNKIIAAKWAGVMVFDTNTQMLRMRATNMTHPGAKDVSIPLSAQSLAITCLKQGKTLISSDMFNDPRCNQEMNKRFRTASGVCVPLGPHGQRFGVLMVYNPEPGEFSADEVRRLEQVAQLASAAIERSKLYEEACQRADELILLNEVGHLLVENPALESTLQRIADLVCRSFQLSGAGFLILNDKREALISRGITGDYSPLLKHLRIPLDVKDITTQAFRTNQTLTVNRNDDSRVHRFLFKLLPNAVSGAVLPMSGVGGAVGVLGVWQKHAHVFLPRDLQVLAGIARLAAAAVSRDELGQALRASEKRLQEVVDGIHAMIVSIDPRGRILSFNAAAERVSGLNRESVLGQLLAQIVSPKPTERARIEAALEKAFKEKDCSQDLVLNWATPGAKERKIRWSSSFLCNPEGLPTGMVCLGIDITEQILLEAQLLQAQKMESVGSLAGGMAHDFNNLLGGIIGQCTLARAQSDDELMLSAMSKIESAAHRGADLTAKLMAFARKSVLQPRAVDLGALIKESSELLGGSLPRSIRVVTILSDQLPPVYGDPTQLQQVILNLCVNARDAMPRGGTLTLSAAPEPHGAPRGSADPAQAVPGILFEVSDTGTGMTEEVQHRLFEPFFTTKEPGKGTGLGLSVVFGIVRSHGGKIQCHSQLGKGTRFSIHLPGTKPSLSALRSGAMAAIGSQAEMNAVRLALPNAAAFAGSEKVLLIDDDAILRDTMRQLLISLGYKVKTAIGGSDAITQLDKDPDYTPDVLLLDVMMPGLAGFSLFSEIRTRQPHVPIILISGYSADQTVHSLLNAGARELIQKPFTLEKLAGAIRRALAPAQSEHPEIK